MTFGHKSYFQFLTTLVCTFYINGTHNKCGPAASDRDIYNTVEAP